MKLSELLKGNQSNFVEYRAGYFYYEIAQKTTGDVYKFPIPIEDLDGATIRRVENALTTMRWIRKAIEENTFVLHTRTVGEFDTSLSTLGPQDPIEL